MTDRSGTVLYVGKAKSLRDRVSSYFSDANTRGTKLHQMMRAVKDITYEDTGSELSALLLESRKIKELTPRFNSLERRYRTYTFLKLDVQNDFPRLEVVREPMQDGSEYYGPFRSWDTVSALVDVLNRSFQLRECGDNFTVSKTNKPCFYHEIHRCGAPCAMKEKAKAYRAEVDRLRTFLAAGEEGVLASVEAMMMAAAERLDFEEAQFLKLRLFELRRVIGSGERSVASLNTNDFVIMTKSEEEGAEVYFVRFGRLVKQINVNASHIERAQDWFAKQLRMYYSDATNAIPPTCGKPEVDEMRILSAWADRKRRQGSTVVYLTSEWDMIVPKLARSLTALLTEVKKPIAEVHKVASSMASIELNPLPVAVTSEPEIAAPKAATKKKQVGRIVLRPMNTE
jgi:DNA polymerase-3 subunit epsilon